MSQVNADVGNLLMYEKATARMLSKTATTAEFELTVPYPGAQESSESVYVKLKKWRDTGESTRHRIFFSEERGRY